MSAAAFVGGARLSVVLTTKKTAREEVMHYNFALSDYCPPSMLSANSGCRQELNAHYLCNGEDQDGNVTLVVVDMQPGFHDAIDRATLDAVERQIQLAVMRNWAIVLLENEPWRNGPTYPQLLRHLQNERGQWTYKRAFMRVKATDSGAGQVIEACEDFCYPMQYFRVCGVYLDACVEQTVLGLLRGLPSASVRCIREAMNTNYKHEDAWAMFPVRPYLVVSSEQIDWFCEVQNRTVYYGNC